MFSSLTVISFFCLYMAVLFNLARWAERHAALGRSKVNNPLVYSLSLAVYCTTWTYYGSVGSAANDGLLFLAVYLGPTLVVILWGSLLRKLVRLKNNHHITSIADFISVRYEKSESLAALATLVALVGAMPYIALQLKAIFQSFALITPAREGPAGAWIGSHVGPIIVGLMVMFTIAFGVRRLDPTERHEGMVMVVAAESLVKLVLFVAAGVFVVYFVWDGLDPLLTRFAQEGPIIKGPGRQETGFLTWGSWLLLSMSAVMFLPRQFHIAVVENQSENHIRQAMWLFPLYMLIITFFAFPIAVGGVMLGYPPSQADLFVLLLPLQQGESWLALLVFLGGFSAATSMILISSMTMATMISNHLLLPLVDWIPQLGFIERHLLQARWLSVAGFILMGYWFERTVGESLMLVNIGMISFAAVLQFAVPILGGVLWRGGNKNGAMLGLAGGFAVWVYTLLLPSFAKGGMLPGSFVENGPLGISLLRPENLLGVEVLDPVTHTVFWSMLINIGLYVAGSLAVTPSEEGVNLAEEFVGMPTRAPSFNRAARRAAYIELSAKEEKIVRLLSRYFGRTKAAIMTSRAVGDVGLLGRKLISITELAELYNEVEKSLAGSVGSAQAHKALARAGVITDQEAKELSEVYAEILAELRARPRDLIQKIDFYQEREALIRRHAAELEEKVAELENQVAMRKKAQKELRESEERYRTAIEYSNDGVAIVKDGSLLYFNRKFAEIFGYPQRRDLLGLPLTTVIHPSDQDFVLKSGMERALSGDGPNRYDLMGMKKDGTPIYVAVSSTSTTFQGQKVLLVYIRDVTARRRAEDEIRHLSRRLIEGIEEERKRLSQDLHDEFGQALTALHFGMESLEGSLGPEQKREQVLCDELIDVIESLADNIRKVSSDLRPDMLDHLGLIPTLQWFVGEFTRRTGIGVEFQSMGLKRRLSPQTEIVLYRILQEALTNVAKHAQARLVSVQLTYSHPMVIMVIRDDGVGFHQPKGLWSAGLVKGGIGLLGIRERVASVGGKVDIRSTPGKGTQIRAELPAGLEETDG